jgi:hypothetical protein
MVLRKLSINKQERKEPGPCFTIYTQISSKWIKYLSRRKNKFLNGKVNLALVAHICNPSYSGGRDQEDSSLKPAWAKWFRFPRPYLEKAHHKKGLAEWLKVWALSSKPSTLNK